LSRLLHSRRRCRIRIRASVFLDFKEEMADEVLHAELGSIRST
jgi:hypothetical protein